MNIRWRLFEASIENPMPNMPVAAPVFVAQVPGGHLVAIGVTEGNTPAIAFVPDAAPAQPHPAPAPTSFELSLSGSLTPKP